MELLKQLSNAVGPSGFEGDVREFVSKEMKKYVDEVSIDKIGNLICHKKGKGPKVMLAAHMDEVGLIVNEIQEDGKLKFSRVGGIEPFAIIGQKVAVIGKKKSVTGVVSFLELHEGLKIQSPPSLFQLYVDTGLKKEELEKIGVRIGSYIVMKQDFEFLGSEDLLCGKALDDRVGCYILIELAKRLKNMKNDIYYVFTVQEEIGLHGAKVSVEEIDPEWGIAVDTTSSDDSGNPKRSRLGGGPCITVKDAEVISNSCINNWLEEIAKENKIPIQFKVDEFATSDAAKIMLSKQSVPSTAVNVPIRNIHSSVGIAHRKDIENTISLLYNLLKNPPKKCIV